MQDAVASLQMDRRNWTTGSLQNFLEKICYKASTVQEIWKYVLESKPNEWFKHNGMFHEKIQYAFQKTSARSYLGGYIFHLA